MKRTILAASGLLLLAAAVVAGTRSAGASPPDAALTVDPVHSAVLFRIKHMGASWVWGRFNDLSATVTMDDACAQVKEVSFGVKAESVDTHNDGRDKHLRSPDFFNAKQFPDISFKSTSVKQGGADSWDVTGDLALHGVTKPLTVTLKKVGEGEMKGTKLIGFETTFTVKRSDFEMTKDVGPGGDDVMMIVCVESSRK